MSNYILNHSHPNDNSSKCVGNPQLVVEDHLPSYLDKLQMVDIEQTSDGKILAVSGMYKGMQFSITRLEEKEGSLDFWQRMSYVPPFENYRMSIEVDWDKQPRAILENPEALNDLANAQDTEVTKLDVYSFVNDSLVHSVILSEGGIIEGYDVGSMSRYTFTPSE